jgi:hypothetical protein
MAKSFSVSTGKRPAGSYALGFATLLRKIRCLTVASGLQEAKEEPRAFPSLARIGVTTRRWRAPSGTIDAQHRGDPVIHRDIPKMTFRHGHLDTSARQPFCKGGITHRREGRMRP